MQKEGLAGKNNALNKNRSLGPSLTCCDMGQNTWLMSWVLHSLCVLFCRYKQEHVLGPRKRSLNSSWVFLELSVTTPKIGKQNKQQKETEIKQTAIQHQNINLKLKSFQRKHGQEKEENFSSFRTFGGMLGCKHKG